MFCVKDGAAFGDEGMLFVVLDPRGNEADFCARTSAACGDKWLDNSQHIAEALQQRLIMVRSHCNRH